MECEEEVTTQHKWGPRYGCGPIKCEENLLLAVFKTDQYDSISKRLKNNFFKRSKLKKFDVSLARQNYISKKNFKNYVIKPRTVRGEVFVGVAIASASAIRKISFLDANQKPKVQGRGFCVLDIVEPPEDHDSHAALGYSEKQEVLTQKQKDLVRSNIDVDLVDSFSAIKSIDEITFGVDPNTGRVRRILSKLRKNVLALHRRLSGKWKR